MEITTLRVSDRNRIWRTLNKDQQEVFNKYIRYQMNDRLLTQTFQGAAQWRLYAVNIDYDWEARKAGLTAGAPLRCKCGRRLRYQYELESIGRKHKHVKLGSTHFAEHLGIPLSVAKEVRSRVGEIQSVMDELLVKFDHKERFPTRFNAKIQDGLLSISPGAFANRILDFQRVDLPLFSRDLGKLHQMMMKYSPAEIAAAKSEQSRAQSSPSPKQNDPATNLERNQKYSLTRVRTHISQQLDTSIKASQRSPMVALETQYLDYLKTVSQSISTVDLTPQFGSVDTILFKMRDVFNAHPRNPHTKLINKLAKIGFQTIGALPIATTKELTTDTHSQNSNASDPNKPQLQSDTEFQVSQNYVAQRNKQDFSTLLVDDLPLQASRVQESGQQSKAVHLDTFVSAQLRPDLEQISLPISIDPLIRSIFNESKGAMIEILKQVEHTPVDSEFSETCQQIGNEFKSIVKSLSKKKRHRRNDWLPRVSALQKEISALS